MTHKTVLFVTMMLMAASSFAQVQFGIRAGVQKSNFKLMNEMPDLDLDMKSGLEAGFFVEIPVSPWFAIQPELGYASYGANVTMPNIKGSYEVEYISIPVLAKYRLRNGLAFLAGPSVNFVSAAQFGEDGQDKGNAIEYFKKNDILATAGIEYNFPFGLAIGARFNQGLTNITYELTNGIRNQSVGVHLAYKFRVSNKKK